MQPLVEGGQHAPQASVGTYLNAKWQFSANGMYQVGRGFEVAASLFGRQGYPFPIYRSATLGADTLNVLVSPEVDSDRLDNLWTTDLRVGKSFRIQQANLRVVGDLFNAFNSTNWGCYDTTIIPTADQATDAGWRRNFGQPKCAGLGRRLQIGLRYGYRGVGDESGDNGAR